MEAKTQVVAELESKVAALQTSLDEAVADANAKESSVEELEKAKAAIESELAEVKAAVEAARADRDGDSTVLQSVQEEVYTSLLPSCTHVNNRWSARSREGRKCFSDRDDSGFAGAD